MTSARNEILTREVCEVLNVTPSAVSRMVKRGALKPFRVIPTARAGVFVFRRRDVERFAARRAEKVTGKRADRAAS
ncbi:helix-turn-helix domain-containing protein [Mycobacterium sp. D16Q16]|uniref:helix-turn-helix domain-containing protein n=1 Tax=Mycobacterium sp. D16Q16 TaxID=1855659 RepID=UPI000991BC1B|nr:helix-turn-helix domain-containing protein [Mycobacterium sp. D16Q16]